MKYSDTTHLICNVIKYVQTVDMLSAWTIKTRDMVRSSVIYCYINIYSQQSLSKTSETESCRLNRKFVIILQVRLRGMLTIKLMIEAIYLKVFLTFWFRNLVR